MRQVDQDQQRFPLGKPIREEPAPKEDEYEKFTGAHGDPLYRNKRTGEIETANQGWPYDRPRRLPPEPPATEPVIWTIEQMDAYVTDQQKKQADGFHPYFYGSW